MVQTIPKIFPSRTGGPISKKFGTKHRWLKFYNVDINHDPVVTLAYFRTMPTSVAYAVEVKLLKCYLKSKTCRKMADGHHDIDYTE